MRMWMVPVAYMCNQHLLGEHVEIHMLIGSLVRQKSITGFIANNCLQPKAAKIRHDRIAKEMQIRGMNHNSPLIFKSSYLSYLPNHEINYKVDSKASLKDLVGRCPNCRKLYIGFSNAKGEKR